MNERFGRLDAPEARLEAELSGWLRSLEPAPMPIGARLRISADLRVEAARPRRTLSRVPQFVSAAASLLVVLAWAGLFLFVVTSTSTGSYSVGAPTGPNPIVAPDSGPISSPWLIDPLGLVVILVLSVLAGVSLSMGPIRAGIRRVAVGRHAVVAHVVPLPRRLRKVPRLALLLAILPVSYMVTQPYVHPPMLSYYSISMFLPAALAAVVALRYPVSDRSSRWLLIGAVALALATPQFLETNWTLTAFGWLALAIGLAARAGVAPRPRWFAVAVAVGAVLYVQVDSAIGRSMAYSPAFEYLPRLLYQAVMQSLDMFAWMAIFWTAFTCLRRGGGQAWILVLAGTAGLFGLQLYHVLDYPILGLTDWLMTSVAWLRSDDLALTNVLAAVGSLSYGALLLALLIGLVPVRAASASEPADGD